jgi:hypothetical protein
MPSIKQNYQTTDTLTITLASLGNNSGRASTKIDNTTMKAIDGKVYVKIRTGATVSTTGYVSVWLLSSFDGTNFDDNFGGTDGGFTPTNSRLLGYITANTANTTFTGVFHLDALGFQLPPYFSIGIYNASGGALDSTAGNHSVIVQRFFKDIV